MLVPVLNEAEMIRDTVAHMQAQRFDGRLEFIFVDGRSRDGTREILRELAGRDARIRVLDNPARRVPQALNVGLRNSTGEYVVRMDAHTRYPPEYIDAGVRRLQRGDVDWVSGPQLAVAAGPWSRRVAMALRSRLGVGGASFRLATDQEIDVDTGFTGIWRRGTLEVHEGWDEGWPVNQDAELAARIRAAGGRIVCIPEMAASYVPRESLVALARQYYSYGMYRAKTSHRHPESMRRSQALPPALVVALAGALVGPARVRRALRVPVGAYAVVVVVESVRQAEPGRRLDAALLPAVFATMHLAWGSGFIEGSRRFGLPLAALARALRPASPPRRVPGLTPAPTGRIATDDR
ncbi:MAG TPA: glycosyltransferase family 2 protein [Solirubrobacteraceae bacterium]|nr:glycosyltransferase family 2 protein [Solirubrobacteraceae bacterium]